MAKSQKVNSKNNVFKLMGKAILLASIQASIGSVEMSSKFSVINFSKDQRTLQAAADALAAPAACNWPRPIKLPATGQTSQPAGHIGSMYFPAGGGLATRLQSIADCDWAP